MKLDVNYAPLEAAIAAGWECREVRQAVHGDWTIVNGDVQQWLSRDQSFDCHPILTRKQPRQFPGGWPPKLENFAAIARDGRTSYWYAYEKAPRVSDDFCEWVSGGQALFLASAIARLFNVTLPPASDDWTQDIYINPAMEG